MPWFRSAKVYFLESGYLTYKIPAIVIDRRHFCLEVYTTLALNDVVIAKALVPRDLIEDALAVHVDPSLLEAEDSASGEVYATVVEVVAHGYLRNNQ